MPWPPWLVLALCTLRSAEGDFRNYSCLANASHSPSERKNVTINGVSRYLRIGSGNWDTPLVEAWIFRIIVEDVLGINTEGPKVYSASVSVLDATATADCEIDVGMGTWESPAFKSHQINLQQLSSDTAPISVGTMGYTGYEGFYMQEDSLTQAMQHSHLYLDSYTIYSRPNVDFHMFFDSLFTIDQNRLELCSMTQLNDIAEYIEATGDSSGISVNPGLNGVTYGAACLNGYWWVSPACRANTSKCIPSIVDSRGYAHANWLMQKSFFWKMPIVVAIPKDWGGYLELPRQSKLIYYGWGPDASFKSMRTAMIHFPEYDARLWQRGIYKTESQTCEMGKWACKQIQARGTQRTSQLVETLRNMQFSLDVAEELMVALSMYSFNDTSRYEAVACQWLKNKTYPWEDWIALSTACADRQGLVSKNGSFVKTRSEASACNWCTPGRQSKPLLDDSGMTYTCEQCDAGTFQMLAGAFTCDPCEPGEAAPRKGMSKCEQCPIGRYAAGRGLAACQACPTDFSTAFLGAWSLENCTCKEGLYRDMYLRENCSGCPMGMKCPAGSDELGYVPAHSADHPVVPRLEPGFWSSIEDPLEVYACENIKRCPGGVPGNACSGRLIEQGCGACEDGYYWTGWECRKCVQNVVRNVLGPIFVSVGAPFTVYLVYYMSGDPYVRWGRWYHGVGAAICIILEHYQLIYAVDLTNLQHPGFVEELFELVQVFTHTVSLMRPNCYGFHNYTAQLVIQSLGPVMILAVYLVTWLGSQVIGLRYHSVKMQINRTVEGFLTILFVFFCAIVGSSYSVFKCGRNPNGNYSLIQDRRVICYQGEWISMAVIGSIAILIWCVGLALLFAMAVWRAPRQLHDASIQRWWRFLFIRYRPDVHWWALLLVAKSLLVHLGSALVISAIGQVYWIVAIMLIYVYLLTVFRPYRHVLNNLLDVWVSLCLFFTCLVITWSSSEPSLASDWGDTIGQKMLTTTFFFFVCLPLVPICGIMAYRQIGKRAFEIRRLDLERIFSSSVRVAELTPQAFRSFMDVLHERDYYLMLDVMYCIQTELAGNKCRPGYSANFLRKREISLSHYEPQSTNRPSLFSLDSVPRNPEWIQRSSTASARSAEPPEDVGRVSV